MLDRYLFVALLRGGIPVVLLLMGLFGFLELAEQLEDVGKGSYSSNDALRVAALHLPRLLIDLLPVTCLLGAIVGYGGLARDLELGVLRTSGWSLLRIARPVMLMTFVIGAVVLAAQQWLVPVLEGVASDLRSAVYASSSRDDAAYWTRGGDRLLRVGGVAFGRQPVDVDVYLLDDKGLVREIQRAASADVLAPREWLLRNVTRVRLDGDTPIVEQVAVLPLEPDFDADQIYTLINADYALAPLDLIAYIRHLHGNDLDAHRYEVLLWQMLSLPLGLVAMGLLGLPVVVGSTRSLSLGARIAIGGAVGIGFYLLERLLTQLALLYRLSPPLTGLLPDLVALGVAVWLILSRE